MEVLQELFGRGRVREGSDQHLFGGKKVNFELGLPDCGWFKFLLKLVRTYEISQVFRKRFLDLSSIKNLHWRQSEGPFKRLNRQLLDLIAIQSFKNPS